MDEKKEGEKSSWEEEAEANGLEWGEGKAPGAPLIGKSSMQRIIFCQFWLPQMIASYCSGIGGFPTLHSPSHPFPNFLASPIPPSLSSFAQKGWKISGVGGGGGKGKVEANLTFRRGFSEDAALCVVLVHKEGGILAKIPFLGGRKLFRIIISRLLLSSVLSQQKCFSYTEIQHKDPRVHWF